jgi:hypothetical protein
VTKHIFYFKNENRKEKGKEIKTGKRKQKKNRSE